MTEDEAVGAILKILEPQKPERVNVAKSLAFTLSEAERWDKLAAIAKQRNLTMRKIIIGFVDIALRQMEKES